ncbi:uncharacterized protein LOC111914817 [Lactuca sativa]|uniref:uncharacterized protein LOC111914817 n=1 Tax=Lactuca sativa TaxID=4236 RepID=UPI0022AE67E3|nr:uncharacterized protein LOC111914817 [Lactuca sativa]
MERRDTLFDTAKLRLIQQINPLEQALVKPVIIVVKPDTLKGTAPRRLLLATQEGSLLWDEKKQWPIPILSRKRDPEGQLDSEGYVDWQHLSTRLKEHEVGLDHLTNLYTWCEMCERLKVSETIDKVGYDQFNKEREHWKKVLLRIIALMKYLAEHNLAFRGTNEKLYQKSNGNFLGVIEMFEEFNLVRKEHVHRITNDEIHVHYLGHKIKNEGILLLADEIKQEIIKKVKEEKYYYIILDCAAYTSHQEHLYLIVSVEEYFLGFLNVKGLFDITYNELKSLGLDIDNMRGEENIKRLTPKSLSATQWESRVDSVKAIRQQLSDFGEALLEVAEKYNDAKIQSEAKSPANNELGGFDFLEFRETRFSKAIDIAKELSVEMNIDPIFSQKRPVSRKKQFDENSSDQDVVFSVEENFKVNYFLYIVDQASASLKTRFQQYKEYENIFDLKSCCSRLEATLKSGEQSDIDSHELYMELKLLDMFLPREIMSLIDVLKYMKKVDCFPNEIIAYIILLTILVTFASAKRSFSN